MRTCLPSFLSLSMLLSTSAFAAGETSTKLGAAGALYKTASGLTLRAEAGGSGLKVGVGWLF